MAPQLANPNNYVFEKIDKFIAVWAPPQIEYNTFFIINISLLNEMRSQTPINK